MLAVMLILLAAPAFALEVKLVNPGPSVVGEPHTFEAIVTDAKGPTKLEWRFSESDEPLAADARATHTYTAPGLYSVDVTVTDASGDSSSDFKRHLVHYPLTKDRPTSASPIVYDPGRNLVYSLNQDNDTLTAIDPEKLSKVNELEVYRRPESLAVMPDGKLWVVHQDDYAIAVIDPSRFVIERGFRLPYASQPVSIALSPVGDAAYVVLMALGKLLKLDPKSGNLLDEVEVGPRPRGLAVSHDGKDVYVTRFISPDQGGEVVKVDASGQPLRVATRIVLPTDRDTMDSDQRSRGVPNYLFAIGLTPDGRQGWVPGKKDNILRGKLRDGQDLTHDTIVRPLTSVIDLAAEQEILEHRIDLDDRSMPVHVTFSPYGNFAILSLAGSNRVEVRDVNKPTQVFSAIGDVGAFPRASVLTPNARLFVQSALSREVRVYDVKALLEDFDESTPLELGAISTVAHDKVAPHVLAGKKIFHNAEDPRMADEGYMSCGACHFEGIDDGRVWDFSTRGEGLRNTISLIGHGGVRQGPLDWSGNADEVQDFENQIRELFDGLGFMSDDDFHQGTRAKTLGDRKAGVSQELDDLAAYVGSLDRPDPSPYRNPDGSLTADGVAGEALFLDLGCDFCHGGSDFTDSPRGLLHDVGTLTALSGQRAGQPLLGLDTPTLVGVWQTPPYLHDGSAPTLRDVLTTKNPTDFHGYVSALPPRQIDQLVSFLLQIDGEPPVHRLPFDPPEGPSRGPTKGGHADVVGGFACAVGPGLNGPGDLGDEAGRDVARLLPAILIGLFACRRRGRDDESGQPGEMP